MRKSVTITIAAAALLGACHGKSDPGAAAPLAGSTGFQGFRIPGNIVDARATGFRCEPPVAGGFGCATADAVIYGVRATKATVWLTPPTQGDTPAGSLGAGASIDSNAPTRTGAGAGAGADSGAPAHADESYREIVLSFDRPGCTPGSPDASAGCAGPEAQIEQRLDKDGWVYLQKDWGREYYKQGVPLQVTTEFPEQGPAKVVIRSADLQDTGAALVEAMTEAHQRAQDDQQVKAYAERLKATSQ